MAARCLISLLLLPLTGCMVVHGPCVVDREIGKAWCDPGGYMVLVPGKAILDIRKGDASVTVEK